MKLKIAIQGIKGSFHHQVAQQYFGNTIVLEECMSFRELILSLVSGNSDKAIMAIENSIAGSILPNYALIDMNNVHIIGEFYLDIDMNCMALPNQSIYDIKEVHSHPMALLQCADFFSKYPHLKLVESSDTAAVAKQIQDEKIIGRAALAGPIAASIYNLKIVAPSIHTIKNNTTRFVILERITDNREENIVNKASIKFELGDTPGSLATILNVLNNCNLNLTKIQSLPVIENPFTYAFFADVVFEQYENFEKAKAILSIMATHFKVLGEYKKGIS